MRHHLRRPATSAADRGASAVEYGLLVAAIAAIIVAVVFGMGGLVRTTYQNTCVEWETRNNEGVNDSQDC